MLLAYKNFQFMRKILLLATRHEYLRKKYFKKYKEIKKIAPTKAKYNHKKTKKCKILTNF